jgi:hypothetical protein
VAFQKRLLRLETATDCKTVQLQVSTKAASYVDTAKHATWANAKYPVLPGSNAASVDSLFQLFRKRHIHSNIASRLASDATSYSRRTYFQVGHTSEELCART